MRKFNFSATALILFLSTVFAFSQSDLMVWNGSSEELEKYINSKDEHKNAIALQKIIMNPEIEIANYLCYDIYRMYRNHNNDKIRQMALVALYKMEHFNLLKNLKDDLYEEKNPQLRRQIFLILEKMPVLTKLD